MKKNSLIKKFREKKQWVNYRMVKVKDRMTKVPYAIDGKPASSTDAASWATYDEAVSVSKNVGIVFTPEEALLGIDIDHCLDEKTKNIIHEQKEIIANLVLEADTYTEISPSGTGLHIFLEIDGGGLSLESNKRAPYEAYTSGRYFTVTGNSYGKDKEVRKVSKEEALKILSIIGYPWQTKTIEVAAIPETTSILRDEAVIEKMFASKGGEKVKALYGGDLSAHKKDASSADMALLSHLAFWTRRDAAQMERLWIASPLGNREKTLSREDYRKRSIAKAVSGCKTVYETKATRLEKDNPDLDLLYVFDAKGGKSYIMNTENMCRILRGHENFKGRFRYDSFRNVFEILSRNRWRLFEDNDAVNIQTAISIHFSEFFGTVGKVMVYDAMMKVAKENAFDSAIDFIKGIKWDGTARLDSWLQTVYGAPDDEYHRAVASNWIKGLVSRIVYPGCKFDYVMVLEGEQGTRKSTSLSILGGDWHVETTMSTESKDFFMQFQGKAIVEFSEGETFSRTEVKRMKAIITMQSDKYRPPYERTSQDFPRRCVFAMTTNQTEYLKDETGNRRWLPVAVLLPQANTDWLRDNRNQLFAEAYHRIEVLKETTYEFPVEATKMQQEIRRVSDPHQDIITEWYYTKVNDVDKEEGITIDRVYKEALHGNFPSRPINKSEEMNIASVLKNGLRLTRRSVMKNNIRNRRWFNETGKPMKAENESVMAEALRNF